MAKTLVLDINEIYQVIPETRRLEGKNFKDIRELLKELITAVEASGKWEFIQYVNNKPSLFLVKDVSNVEKSNFDSSKFQEIENIAKDVKYMFNQMQNGITNQPSRPVQPTPVTKVEPVNYTGNARDMQAEEELKTSEMIEAEKAIEENLSTSVSEVKLPWEK